MTYMEITADTDARHDALVAFHKADRIVRAIERKINNGVATLREREMLPVARRERAEAEAAIPTAA